MLSDDNFELFLGDLNRPSLGNISFGRKLMYNFRDFILSLPEDLSNYLTCNSNIIRNTFDEITVEYYPDFSESLKCIIKKHLNNTCWPRRFKKPDFYGTTTYKPRYYRTWITKKFVNYSEISDYLLTEYIIELLNGLEFQKRYFKISKDIYDSPETIRNILNKWRVQFNQMYSLNAHLNRFFLLLQSYIEQRFNFDLRMSFTYIFSNIIDYHIDPDKFIYNGLQIKIERSDNKTTGVIEDLVYDMGLCVNYSEVPDIFPNKNEALFKLEFLEKCVDEIIVEPDVFEKLKLSTSISGLGRNCLIRFYTKLDSFIYNNNISNISQYDSIVIKNGFESADSDYVTGEIVNFDFIGRYVESKGLILLKFLDKSVDEIAVPYDIIEVYNRAFWGCKNLKRILIHNKTMKFYSESFSIGFKKDCEILSPYKLADYVEELEFPIKIERVVYKYKVSSYRLSLTGD